MMPFCPSCFAYFPAGPRCPRCGQEQPAVQIPTAPGHPCWQACVPGNPARHINLAQVEGRPVLVVPWGYQPRWGQPGRPDGGVTLFSWEDGRELGAIHLGRPVQGGVSLAPGGEGSEVSAICGTALAGVGGGQGELIALDLSAGEERWRVPLGGAVRGAPAVDNLRVYAAACDGRLYCLDLRNRQPVWPEPVEIFEGPTEIPASPLIVREKGMVQAIIVATYGSVNRRLPGRVVAVDESGRILWNEEAGGHVHGTPVVARGRVYVTAFRDLPSAGVLTAFDLRRGQPAWPQPFVIQAQPDEHRRYNLSASPLYHRGVLYVGSLNHYLYALDADTGEVHWKIELGGGIATVPAWVEGLLIVGCNDGKVYGLDPEAKEVVWTWEIGASVLTDPQVLNGLIAVAAHDGSVAVLPWHLGQYSWAGKHLEQAGNTSAAGDCYALAAHFNLPGPVQDAGYARAAECWERAGEPEKAAEMWLALERWKEAAQAFRRAGEAWRGRDPRRAAGYFRRAADLYFRLRQGEALNACTRALAECADLPYIRLQPVNVPTFVQWESGELTLRLFHEGKKAIPEGLRLYLGGTLKNWVQAEIASCFEPGAVWNIPLSLVATQTESVLEVELEYDSGHPEFGLLREILCLAIRATEPRRPPPSIHVGDVGFLQLGVNSQTAEGLQIVTRDVGLMRVFGSEGVSVAGYAGAAISCRDAASIQASCGTGPVYRVSEQAGRCPSCGQPLLTSPEQKYCDHCGADLSRWEV